jgi:hypothetical protein
MLNSDSKWAGMIRFVEVIESLKNGNSLTSDIKPTNETPLKNSLVTPEYVDSHDKETKDGLLSLTLDVLQSLRYHLSNQTAKVN